MPSACPELARSTETPTLRRKKAHSRGLQRIGEDPVIPGASPFFQVLQAPPNRPCGILKEGFKNRSSRFVGDGSWETPPLALANPFSSHLVRIALAGHRTGGAIFRFVERYKLPADTGYPLVCAAYMLSNIAVVHSLASRVLQSRFYRPPHVSAGSSHPMCLVGAIRVPLGVLQRSLMDLAADLFKPMPWCSFSAVEPIHQPVVLADS